MKLFLATMMMCGVGLFTVNTAFAAGDIVYVLDFPEVKEQESQYLAIQAHTVIIENKAKIFN